MKPISGENDLVQALTFEQLRELRAKLLKWFDLNGRDWIPWKLKADGMEPKPGENLCAYKILVAEIMLQQTQLKVVLPYWQRWMKAFPTLFELANAEEQEVLILWQGLGYYSRARRLLYSAKILFELIGIDRFQEPVFWPKDLATWMSLPGIGRSTAASILSSAFDLPTPLLDGNVKRVLTRLMARPKPIAQEVSELWTLSEQLLDSKSPRKFNQALMDLGATICTPHNPNCNECPWQFCCRAYSSNNPTDFPVKAVRKSLHRQVIGVGVVLNLASEVLIDQRLNEGLLGGLWEFPGGKQEEGESIEVTIARELDEELGVQVEVGEKLISLDHAYSHKKLRFEVHLCKLLSGEPKPLASQAVRWVDPHCLTEYPFPAANAKMIDALIKYLKVKKEF